MAKLLLIEGIPGSGKTTSSKFIFNKLMERGVDVEKFEEGELHPCDLAWHAVVPKKDFEALLIKHSEYKEIILDKSCVEGDKVVVAYTRLGLAHDEPLVQLLENYEIYQGKVNLEVFKKEHFLRWEDFKDDSDKIYIFECAYFQNHITELVLSYEQDEKYITDYMIELLNIISNMDPTIVYLNPNNLDVALDHVIKERVSDNAKYPDWIELVVDYLKNSNYGRSNHIQTVDDCKSFFKYRMDIEQKLLDRFKRNSIVIDYNSLDWAQLEVKLAEVVESIEAK